MDVLELRRDCAGDDVLHLLGYPRDAGAEEKQSGAQLRRISIPECRIGSNFCRASTRPTTRLVSFRRVQCLFLVRVLPTVLCAHSEVTRFQFSGSATLSSEMEHP